MIRRSIKSLALLCPVISADQLFTTVTDAVLKTNDDYKLRYGEELVLG